MRFCIIEILITIGYGLSKCAVKDMQIDTFAPGMYFPSDFADHNGMNPSALISPMNCNSSPLNQSSCSNLSYNVPSFNVPYNNNQAFNQKNACNVASGLFQSLPVQQVQSFSMPSQINIPASKISPAYIQPPGNKSFTDTCDNSLEKSAFKSCINNSILNLKNVINNCKKVLGEDAKECCIDEKCLEDIKKKRDRCICNIVEKTLDRKKQESLDEFLSFLKKEIEMRKSGNNRSKQEENPIEAINHIEK